MKKDLNQILLDLASEGYAPSLLYDNNGHWALSFDGMMLNSEPEVQCFEEPVRWFDTPLEAAMNALEQVPEAQARET